MCSFNRTSDGSFRTCSWKSCSEGQRPRLPAPVGSRLLTFHRSRRKYQNALLLPYCPSVPQFEIGSKNILPRTKMFCTRMSPFTSSRAPR